MKRLFITTALATTLLAVPAIAAGTDKDKAMKQSEATQAQAGSIEFVSSQKENDWLATALIGRSVQNSQGETLGDINNVVFDENGDVVAVLIGVGGFLGIGGKDVAVTYDALQFKQEERQSVAGEDAREKAYNRNTGRTATPSGSQNPMLDPKREQAANADRKDADQSDMVIVLNATKKQLESAPAFKRLGQAENREQNRSEPASKQDKMEKNPNRQ